MVSRQLAIESIKLRAGTIGVVAVIDIEQVAGHPPGVGNGWREVPRPINAPVTHAVEDLPVGRIEGFPHLVVPLE